MIALLNPRDVDMALDPEIYHKVSGLAGYAESDEIMIHYTVTEQCPFHCRGCINALTAGRGDVDRSTYVPPVGKEGYLERDIQGIAHLIKTSGKDQAVIVYYGGEPMLCLEKMNGLYEGMGREIGSSGVIRYVVITSGHYLERAVKRYPDLASEIWLTALSIDGTHEQHDGMRRGTSLDEIRRQVATFNRFRHGEVLIWSTMRPGMSLLDCFRSFMYFRDRKEAEHFFWHWDEADGTVPDLEGYLEGYGAELHELMRIYVDHLGRGDLLSMIHINELVLYLLTGKVRGSTACGVERMANFDIIGDGKVHGCADLPETMSIGHITESGEVVLKSDAKERLGKVVAYKADLGCSTCGVEAYCGGRCPVQANTGGIGRARQYCFMMRDHVRIVKGYVGRIADIMLERGITLADLYRSARYAKYADVTP
jgi:uncharacterized protein